MTWVKEHRVLKVVTGVVMFETLVNFGVVAGLMVTAVFVGLQLWWHFSR